MFRRICVQNRTFIIIIIIIVMWYCITIIPFSFDPKGVEKQFSRCSSIFWFTALFVIGGMPLWPSYDKLQIEYNIGYNPPSDNRDQKAFELVIWGIRLILNQDLFFKFYDMLFLMIIFFSIAFVDTYITDVFKRFNAYFIQSELTKSNFERVVYQS